MIRRAIWPVLILVALSLALLPGCPGKAKRARRGKPPVVLIVVDTLRADHVGCYGYSRPTTPNIDAFAAGAVRFDAAHAAASWTVPSMASLFTGVYAWDHGVVQAQVVGPGEIEEQLTLAEDFVTLAETLKGAGYETFGVSANYHLHEKYGMGQGFDHYKAFGFRDREPVDLQVKDWRGNLAKLQRRGQPYFLYVHYFDPHHPYLPVEPYVREWRPQYEDGQVEAAIGKDFVKRADAGEFFDQPDVMQLLVDLYDSEIRAADDSVGKLLADLPGIEDAVVIVTADHGEAFGDHRNMIHGRDLYRETLRVPLLVRFPDKAHAGRVVPDAVSLVDVYPTVAAAVGAETPPYLAGLDLRAGLDTGLPADRVLFAETERGTDQHWRAAITTGRKWLHLLSSDTPEFYDLAADPLETRNLLPGGADEANDFRRAWLKKRRVRPRFKPGSAGALDPALRDQLKNLGYL